MADYLPSGREARYGWFQNMSSVLGTLASQLGLPQAATDGYQAGYTAALAKKKTMQDAKQAYELAQADFNTYDKGFSEVTRKLVIEMKNATAWNDNFAKTAGVYIAPVVLDLVNAQPDPRIKIVTGQPQIDFFKHGFDGVNIERKINDDKDFVFLASPQFSPYIDTDPLRVSDIAEIRYYRLTFIKNDQEAGKVSAVVWIAMVV